IHPSLFDRNPLSSSLDRSFTKPGTITTADPLVLPRRAQGDGGCRFSRRQMSRVSPPTMRLPMANGSIRTPGRGTANFPCYVAIFLILVISWSLFSSAMTMYSQFVNLYDASFFFYRFV
ncbi:unnamed protein product, partial [Musa textilis]